MRDWLRRAFAIETDAFTASAEEGAIADRFAAELVRRGLATPALLFLEMSHPLNFVVSQFLLFCGPVATLIFSPAQYRTLVGLLERRGSVEYICSRIESALAAGASPPAAASAEPPQRQTHESPPQPQ